MVLLQLFISDLHKNYTLILYVMSEQHILDVLYASKNDVHPLETKIFLFFIYMACNLRLCNTV